MTLKTLQIPYFIFISCMISAILMPYTANAQKTNDTPLATYVATGLSVSNTGESTFGQTSYPSVELGWNKGSLSFGLVVGRSDNNYSGKDKLSNYWWEVKTALSIPVGSYSTYGLLGLGNYMSTDKVFIEYGLGFSHTWDQFSLFSQISNWDGLWYLTPGVSYTF